MSAYRPTFGKKEFPPAYVPKAHVEHRAWLNPIPVGSSIRATLDEDVVVGKVEYASEEYAQMVVTRDLWRNNHFVGKVEHRLDMRLPWDVTILIAVVS